MAEMDYSHDDVMENHLIMVSQAMKMTINCNSYRDLEDDSCSDTKNWGGSLPRKAKINIGALMKLVSGLLEIIF